MKPIVMNEFSHLSAAVSSQHTINRRCTFSSKQSQEV
jgi:hypothetical protein